MLLIGLYLGIHINFFFNLKLVDICVSLPSHKTPWDTSVGLLLVADLAGHSCQVMSFLGKVSFLCQQTCTTSLIMLCYSNEYYMLNVCQSPACLFVFFTFFPAAASSEMVSVATESSSLVITSSWCGYSYGCHAQSLDFLFSGFWNLKWNLVRTSDCWTNACIEWLFVYLEKWLPYIWIISALKVICVIKVVQYNLSFPD